MDTERLLESRRRLYRYQVKVLEERYADIEDIEDLRHFFFHVLYVSPDDTAAFQERNREFIRVSGNWLLRLLAGGYVVGVLRQIIELHEITDTLDARVAAHLAARPEWLASENGDPALYREACRAATTRRERERQVNCAAAGFDLVAIVVRQAPFDLPEIVRRTPKIFFRNKNLLELSEGAFTVFKRHRARLDAFRRIFLQREMDYIAAIFSPPEGC